MKKTKYMISILIFALLMVLNGEFFQKQLFSFSSHYYFVDYAYIKGENRNELIDDILYVCEKHEIEVFSLKQTTISKGKYEIDIYGNETVYKKLKAEYSIEEKEYKSAISGNTTIKFLNFENTASENQIERFYFIGNDEKVASAVYELFDLQGKTRIRKENAELEEYIAPMLYALAFTFIILLNFFDISFQKKEILIKISMGASSWKIILMNIIKDTIFYCCLAFVLNSIIGKYTYIFYHFGELLFIFCLFLLLNAVSYLSILKYDFKQALSNSPVSNSLRGNCYILKIFTMIVTMITVAANIVVIKEGFDFLGQKKMISHYDEYSFVDLYYYEGVNVIEKDGYIEKEYAITAGMFYDLYRENKVALNILCTTDLKNRNYLCVNENAVNSIGEIPEIQDINEDVDIHIFIPESEMSDSEKIIKSSLEDGIGEICSTLKNLDYEVIQYEGKHQVLYFSQENAMHSGYADNPVIIYCTFQNNVFPDSNIIKEENLPNITDIFSNVMYQLSESEIEFLQNKYGLNEMGMYFSGTTVLDSYDYYKNQIMKILITNTMISGLMIFLEIVIISAILKMEYVVNAKELAVKKVLGYSIFQKNKPVEFLILFSSIVGMVFTIILAVMFDLAAWHLVLLSGVLLMLFEHFIIMYYAVKIENSNITKILKGGCL